MYEFYIIESQVWEIKRILEEPGVLMLLPTYSTDYLIEIMTIAHLYDHFHKTSHPLKVWLRFLNTCLFPLAMKLTPFNNQIILLLTFKCLVLVGVFLGLILQCLKVFSGTSLQCNNFQTVLPLLEQSQPWSVQFCLTFSMTEGMDGEKRSPSG